MRDISNGQERLRRWPTSRGKPKTKAERDAQMKFRMVQQAAKYMAPQIVRWYTDHVRGTPLLPRDLLTTMLYQRLLSFRMPDGKEVFPVPAKNDVEDALNAITQTPNHTLVKTENGWEGRDIGADFAASWSLVYHQVITPTMPFVDFLDLDRFHELLVMCDRVTAVGSGSRLLRVSVDNGASFFSTSGDYLSMASTGVTTNASAAIFADSTSTAARSGVLWLPKLPGGGPQPILPFGNIAPRLFVGSPLPINAIRVLDSVSNLNGGNIYVWGR